MWQFLLKSVLLGALLTAADSKGTFYGGHVNPFYGNRYNLFKGGVNPYYTPNKPMSRHKNHCAYVVQKNITCMMQDGVSTFVKAEYTTKCIWGQKCPVVMYRTFYKPTYKVGYKTVTELEWRCCPGYSGESCHDGPTSLPDVMMPPFKGTGLPHRPGMKGFPHSPRPPVDHTPDTGHLEPNKPFPSLPDHRPIPSDQLPVGKPNYGNKFDVSGVTGERVDRMEENLRRLTQGLDTLNGVVAGLEERLRTSLREDTSRFLGSMLATSPRLSDLTVGFGALPDGTTEGTGLDGAERISGFGDLVGRVTEVKDELRAKTHVLEEIQGMVLGHDGQLKRLLESASGKPVTLLEEILDAKLAGVRAEILDGFERRLASLENHCEERIGEVQRQCQREHVDGQEQMQQSLDGRETGLREELGSLQAQIQGLTLTESCCGQVSSLSKRMLLMEESVKGLTESQRQLQSALSDQTVHTETLMKTRLLELESRLNTTTTSEGGLEAGFLLPGGLDGFRTALEDKLKALEERVSVAVEELGNATAPALLEGQAVPALETEIESVRRRVEGDLDGLQKQLADLELLCTSACSPATPPAARPGEEGECEEEERRTGERLDAHERRLEWLNGTLQSLLLRLEREEEEGSVHGEITLLKVNINSVNRTLKGLRDSVSFMAKEVGHTNATWGQRESQLEETVQGITRLVGHQASLLGAGERRLAQLKGELGALKRRLTGELRGCRSAALGVQREVKEVDGRVSQVEGQCGSLGELAEHLERIRAELERHSDSYLARGNGTLAGQAERPAEIHGEVNDQ